MTKDDVKFAKLVVLVNGLVPGALLAWDWAQGQAGTDPVKYVEHTTGMLALIFLMLSLAVTPLRGVTGISWLFYFRRSLGLFAFYYALGHMLIFFVLDQNMSVSNTIREIWKREYLIYGILALLLLVPLAVTSTNGMVKRLGSARWRALHRLVYVVAVLAVIHFGKQVKADFRLPMVFTAVLAVLLGYRLVAFIMARGKKNGAARVPETTV